MIPAEHVLVALAVIGLAGVGGGVWLSAWFRRGLEQGRSPGRQRRSTKAPGERRGRVRKLLAWVRTAVYAYRDRFGAVIYVGIAEDPQERAAQHAAKQPWAGDVVSVEAYWLPNRYMALAAEWALITFLNPRYNRAPSGTCDAWTDPMPPVERVEVEFPTSRPSRVW